MNALFREVCILNFEALISDKENFCSEIYITSKNFVMQTDNEKING